MSASHDDLCSCPFSTALMGRAREIRAALFDVDGVLTDGTLYITQEGETVKAFHALDGHGLKLLQQAGIVPLVVTGRDSPAVRRRLQDLGVVHAVFGAHDKLASAQPLLEGLGLQWGQIAVMGDDWPDLPLMQRAALALAPSNAHREVKAIAHHVSALQGGQGAVRECCDLLLWAAGHYQRLLTAHQQTLDTTSVKGLGQ